ncbi:bifunctional DNA-formamidopyrimidine glycosylase/DNA-(apurinic or apyrimidinic site) lyase [Chloroflexi bacterium TSY]|nr:bifunctional DNA-formamidopyrimidine glycosylase/DNA-(apurinic or apyrimidinic site) lyase [Chloroflexi bacterium TSY]
MPELPEVETYVRELQPELEDRTILEAQVFWPRIIAAPSVSEFVEKIRHQQFTTFQRRGKYILLGLSGGDTLMIHLRMTGELHLYPPDTPPDKHTHIVYHLDDQRHLHYRDQRKFGRIWLVRDTEPILGHLGPEPLDDSFTPDVLAQKLEKRKASIKALLLDQSIVAGIGNIYADEALFRAGIHPTRSGHSLSIVELKRLHQALHIVLERGIELKGSSLQNYIRFAGTQGNLQEEHQVFRKTGQPCPVCGHTIERIIVAQRSTHFCHVCQL